MRILMALMLGTALMMITGCGDDNAGCIGGSCGGNGGDGGAGGNGGEFALIVRWEPVEPCEPGVESDYTINVEAVNAEGDVEVDGSVTGCSGTIDSEGDNTITCPNAATYAGTVEAEDDTSEDTVDFALPVCGSGSSLDP